MDKKQQAKVFISCGQRKSTDEIVIAQQIEDRLSKKGFQSYIAVQQQTLKGLKENIFNELAYSEYFLFVDFKREELDNNDIYRGSLFCHQELAIASFLDLPVLGFQETGVKKDDGILNFLQANCTPFTDRHTLANVVADKVELAGWVSNWKNQLVMSRELNQFSDAFRLPEKKDARFFHIAVKNLHPHKHARNCYAFLESAVNLSTGDEIQLQLVEFKWAGYILPNATILPASQRSIDGFFVFHDSPHTPYFNLFTDSGHFVPNIKGPGDYLMEYSVISDNFSTIKKTFRMHLGNRLEEIEFKPE